MQTTSHTGGKNSLANARCSSLQPVMRPLARLCPLTRQHLSKRVTATCSYTSTRAGVRELIARMLRLRSYCMNTALESLGLIAGNRSLPLEFARQARKLGVKRLVAVAFEGETDPALASLVDEIVWLKVGQLSKMIGAFTNRSITQCVMAGQIAPRNLYEVRPDLRAMGLLFRLKEKNAHTIFGAIADELKKDGVELIEATPWLKPLMPGEGFLLGFLRPRLYLRRFFCLLRSALRSYGSQLARRSLGGGGVGGSRGLLPSFLWL